MPAEQNCKKVIIFESTFRVYIKKHRLSEAALRLFDYAIKKRNKLFCILF